MDFSSDKLSKTLATKFGSNIALIDVEQSITWTYSDLAKETDY